MANVSVSGINFDLNTLSNDTQVLFEGAEGSELSVNDMRELLVGDDLEVFETWVVCHGKKDEEVGKTTKEEVVKLKTLTVNGVNVHDGSKTAEALEGVLTLEELLEQGTKGMLKLYIGNVQAVAPVVAKTEGRLEWFLRKLNFRTTTDKKAWILSQKMEVWAQASSQTGYLRFERGSYMSNPAGCKAFLLDVKAAAKAVGATYQHRGDHIAVRFQ
jgi:hypothetical protein